MCGIVASLRHASCHEGQGLADVAHRGVRRRCAVGDAGYVGHVRLPIVGLDEGWDQPMTRGRWTIAFVGEVLDFRDDDPEAACDAPLVADLWERAGPEALCGRDGFWHVVAMDHGERELHLLCDYLAQKPLYYREDLGAAASEPDALARMAPTTPDRTYLSAAVKWGYCPDARRTPHAEVRRVLPGEHVVLRAGEEARRRIVDRLRPDPAGPAALRRELEAAARRRVASSDVPVALLLSGGLDSAIVHHMTSRGARQVQAFHAENGEEDRARAVTKNFRKVELGDVGLDRALGYMQEPLDLGSLIPQVALSDAVGKREVRVCLTGDGADELFGGYGRSARYDSQASDVWHELVCWHLPRLDRVMMRNRVEVRSPFLARRVVELALGLPRELRTGKKVLRDMFRGELPDEVLDQPKRALRTPEVEADREARSRELVEMFARRWWDR